MRRRATPGSASTPGDAVTRRDPVRRLPTVARLWAAAVLSVVPLGLVLAHGLGAQSPARVFLVVAALAFAVVATRMRTAATLRIGRAGVGALVVAGVLTASQRAVPTLVCVLARRHGRRPARRAEVCSPRNIGAQGGRTAGFGTWRT